MNVLRLVHGEQEFEFLEPVRPGDVLETDGRDHPRSRSAATSTSLEVTTDDAQPARALVVVKGVWTAMIRN